jgi:GT2 family glycosyltransferase
MIKLLSNPNKVAVSGWNQGIRSASGDLIIIVGAHSVYPKDYVRNCVEWSDRAENIGGGILSVVRQDVSALSRAVVMARDDVFGSGSATFRQNSETPVFVDTVFGGCYRREVFDKIGYFNEKLQRSGDLEFNLRLKEAGMKTLYVPSIKSTYFARTNWWDFIKHNFKDGKWSLLMMKYSKVNFGKRRLIPALFLISLPISLWPYLLISALRSFQISRREKDWRLIFTLPIAFLSLHVSYGLGSLWAIPEYLGERGK